MIGPSWQADGSSAVALIALHFVTALIVIPGFAPTLPIAGRRRGRTAADQAGAVEARTTSSGGAARYSGTGSPAIAASSADAATAPKSA